MREIRPSNSSKAGKYLKAVTPKTLIWYKCSFAAFNGAIDSWEAINKKIVELKGRSYPLRS